jgi:hypothetical protein
VICWTRGWAGADNPVSTGTSRMTAA